MGPLSHYSQFADTTTTARRLLLLLLLWIKGLLRATKGTIICTIQEHATLVVVISSSSLYNSSKI
ncbi:ORF50 [White spot syndrome virus]|uniref:ORF50 n=1 Tax=White spot syndrome virus TaxID=342409 RepID=A0A2D3I6U0_9VIRU|nr:ORF50 [White spot syndrome virus]